MEVPAVAAAASLLLELVARLSGDGEPSLRSVVQAAGLFGGIACSCAMVAADLVRPDSCDLDRDHLLGDSVRNTQRLSAIAWEEACRNDDPSDGAHGDH